jgi:SpoVK/Ycf46/Vps4 family AAA+-type ATPase
MLNTLLTSIERFHGLVFLATNKPLDIDEAMHRRISRVYMFRPPNCQQRMLLWESFRSAGLQFSKHIDWNTISMKYELTGGFIKNAVMNALMMACARDVENPVISQEDLVQGCSTQMRGFLQMKASDFAGSIIPKKGLSSLVIDPAVRRTVEDLVSFEKTRSVLFASWRFDETIPEAAGSCVLVSGPLGCGKRTLIEAIAHELGKTLMQFDASVLSKDKMEVVFR